MEFIKGKYYYCTNDVINHNWLSSCCFIKGNSYKARDERSVIDEYGSPIYFPEDSKYTDCFYLKDDETI